MWFTDQQLYRLNPGEELNFILLSTAGISGFNLLAEEANVNFLTCSKTVAEKDKRSCM